MPTEENWLSGICTYTGPGFDLPLGGTSLIPDWFPEKIAKTWDVIGEDGDIIEKKTKELVKGDIITGVKMNTKTLAAIVSTYGPKFYTITDANANHMSLDEWQARYHSNGLGLVAIRNMRKKLR